MCNEVFSIYLQYILLLRGVFSVNDIVNEFRANYERGFNFLFKQIDEASPEVWKGNAGRFHYWQNIYHAFACIDLFILSPGQDMDSGPYSQEVVMFREIPKEVPSKDVIREYGRKKKASADAWLDSLSDEDLVKRHEGMTSRRNEIFSNARALSNLIVHNFYHVGCNDTTLREKGHDGVY